MRIRIIGVARVLEHFSESEIEGHPVDEVIIMGSRSDQVGSLTHIPVIPDIRHDMNIIGWRVIEASRQETLFIIRFVRRTYAVQCGIFGVSGIVVFGIGIVKIIATEYRQFGTDDIDMGI